MCPEGNPYKTGYPYSATVSLMISSADLLKRTLLSFISVMPPMMRPARWDSLPVRFSADVAMNVGMNNGDVAEADEPLGIFFERRPINRINNSYCAVSAPCKQDGGDGSITQCPLKIFRPFCIRSCKLI